MQRAMRQSLWVSPAIESVILKYIDIKLFTEVLTPVTYKRNTHK